MVCRSKCFFFFRSFSFQKVSNHHIVALMSLLLKAPALSEVYKENDLAHLINKFKNTTGTMAFASLGTMDRM